MATEVRVPRSADGAISRSRSSPFAVGQTRNRRWVLVGLYTLLAAVNLARGFLAFRLVPVFANWPLALPLPLLGVVYLSWGLLFLTILVAAVRRFDARTRRHIRVSGTLYQAVIWMIHVIGDRSSYARMHWWQDALMTAGFLATILWLTAPPDRQGVEAKRR